MNWSPRLMNSGMIFAVQNFGRKYDDLNPLNFIDEKIINGINKVYKMNISEAEPKNIGGIK